MPKENLTFEEMVSSVASIDEALENLLSFGLSKGHAEISRARREDVYYRLILTAPQGCDVDERIRTAEISSSARTPTSIELRQLNSEMVQSPARRKSQ